MDASRFKGYCPNGHRPSCESDRVGIFLLTLSFVQKGKQRDNKAAERSQQSKDTKDYHYDFVSRHTHHLPSYVFPYGSRLRGSHSCHGYFLKIYFIKYWERMEGIYWKL